MTDAEQENNPFENFSAVKESVKRIESAFIIQPESN